MRPVTHCKNGHDQTLPGARYAKSRQCRICQLERANRRNAAYKDAGLCVRCSGKMAVRQRTRLGKVSDVHYCPRCAHGYGRGSGEYADIREGIAATNAILALSKQLEHAMPWERAEIMETIASWQKHAQVAAP